MVGNLDGINDGTLVGSPVGTAVGLLVGRSDGTLDGMLDGMLHGATVIGAVDGTNVRHDVGIDVVAGMTVTDGILAMILDETLLFLAASSISRAVIAISQGF